jgi:putative membrane protein
MTGPVLIDLGDQPLPDVGAAPDLDAPTGAAMAGAQAVMGRRAGWGTIVLGAALGLVSLIAGVAAWDFVARLIARVPVLGWLAAGLAGVLALALAVVILREAMGYARLARLDRLRQRALGATTLTQARALTLDLAALYGPGGASHDVMDPDAVLIAAERDWLLTRDTAALAEIEAAARQVALVTALMPLALLDVLAALAANLRMIRRVAAVYGGRAGTLGSLRLARAVMLHLAATGAVALGDDMISSFAGGGVLGKVSRRFGEGVVNGALTARVGLAAMEVCRPLPFLAQRRPSASATVARALKGVFTRPET